jgi:murein DD-endopeptidase MepM/ murein hydrolase activator NlpD
VNLPKIILIWGACFLAMELYRPTWLSARTPVLEGAVSVPAVAVSTALPSIATGELWPGAAPCAGADGWHAGAVDWCGAEGTAVHAPVSGTLREVGSYEDATRYGAYVIIETAQGLEIYVGHLNHEDVNPNQIGLGSWVEAGTVLGYLSEFPYSTPHTHIQLRRGGALVQPGAWWNEWEAR